MAHVSKVVHFSNDDISLRASTQLSGRAVQAFKTAATCRITGFPTQSRSLLLQVAPHAGSSPSKIETPGGGTALTTVRCPGGFLLLQAASGARSSAATRSAAGRPGIPRWFSREGAP
eukprot:5629947-Pyramimonas_sp.AAC.1